jgi:8-oxo-dGTP pyrophosphatase MutT (NUDIX family)
VKETQLKPGLVQKNAVFAIVVSHDFKELYMMRPTNQGRLLHPVGGSVEDGETRLEALQREIREELGLVPSQYKVERKLASRWTNHYNVVWNERYYYIRVNPNVDMMDAARSRVYVENSHWSLDKAAVLPLRGIYNDFVYNQRVYEPCTAAAWYAISILGGVLPAGGYDSSWTEEVGQ